MEVSMRTNLVRSTLAGLFVAAGVTTLVAACDRDRALGTERDTPRRDVVMADKAASIANAVSSIYEARCQREARCNNVGDDKKYASMDACRSKVQSEWSKDLNLSDCPGGVDQKELSECLAEIRNDDCNNPLDHIGRVAACRSSDLCRALP
jgi:hypothetical protein